MSIPTLTNKITTEDGEQDGFHTVHFLYYKRLSKPYGQLKRGWEVRVLKGNKYLNFSWTLLVLKTYKFAQKA